MDRCAGSALAEVVEDSDEQEVPCRIFKNVEPDRVRVVEGARIQGEIVDRRESGKGRDLDEGFAFVSIGEGLPYPLRARAPGKRLEWIGTSTRMPQAKAPTEGTNCGEWSRAA